MTNWEKHKDELLKIACFDNFAMSNGIITRCGNGSGKAKCSECDFNNDGKNCVDEREKWLDKEYVEPPTVDWSKVAVDTKIYVKREDSDEWTPRYFAKYENGKVIAFNFGSTSFSCLSEGGKFAWNYAKLAEEENV